MSTATDNEGATCWICLEAGSDELPLVRDCSCRGSSGFAHLSCLIKYAEQKIEQYVTAGPSTENPWEICHCCNQPYQGQHSVDMATEFVSYVEREFTRHPGEVNALIVGALLFKLRKFSTIGVDQLDQVQRSKCKETALKLASLIAKANSGNTPLMAGYWADAKMHVCRVLGDIHLHDGGDVMVRLAIAYYEECLKLCEAHGCSASIADAKLKIARAKAVQAGGYSCPTDETTLEQLQRFYSECTEILGEEYPASIQRGLDLAFGLKKADRGIESERLVAKLAAISHRVHGPDHFVTKDSQSYLRSIKTRLVLLVHEGKAKCFEVLRYEGSVLVVKGPISETDADNSNPNHKILSIAVENVLKYALGTPVIFCDGLKRVHHLNGKIGDLRHLQCLDPQRYEVHFEDPELNPCLVKPENFKILFDLPEKASP